MLYRELNISDLHIPYHDIHAWELFLNIVKVVKPTKINILGDALDFFQVSKWDKDPEQVKDGTLQENLDQWVHMVRQMQRVAPMGCQYDYLPGNHEGWLRRYLMRNPELYGLRALELASLLRLDELGIRYHEYEIEIIPGLLVGKHGDIVRKDSAYSAKAELEREKYAISTITGHTHRKGTYYVRTRNGIVVAYENGCLCRLDPKYIMGVPNWQQGCSMTTHWGGELFHNDDIAFLNSGERLKAIVLGQVVTL